MYQVYIVDHFLRQLKWYLKKFPHLENDIVELLENFSPIGSVHMGRKLYKIRLKSSDIPKGKNTSFRLMALVLETTHAIVPITLYFKSERAAISTHTLEHHLAIVRAELQTLRLLNN